MKNLESCAAGIFVALGIPFFLYTPYLTPIGTEEMLWVILFFLLSFVWGASIVVRCVLRSLRPRFWIDHLAIGLSREDYTKVRRGFCALGWEIVYRKQNIGDETTAMDTFVVKLGKSEYAPQLAFMTGVDSSNSQKSQITHYVEKFQSGVLQHIAIGTNKLRYAIRSCEAAGLPFLTVLKNGKPHVLCDVDASGMVRQVFTKSVIGPTFFEFKQVSSTCFGLSRIIRTFRDRNVGALWDYVRRSLERDPEDLFGGGGLTAILEKENK